MTTVSPEVIEKWRDEFICKMQSHDNEFKDLNYSVLSGGQIMFNDHKVDLMWEGFLMVRQSAVIELPKPIQSDGFSYWHDFEVVTAIESQGYQVNFNHPIHARGSCEI